MLQAITQNKTGNKHRYSARPSFMSAVVILILAFAVIVPALSAQDVKTSRIHGQILDKHTGEALIGVTVQIEGTSLGAMTDFEGNYRINSVPRGTVTLVIRMVGYKSVTLSDVTVGSEPVHLDYALEEAVVELDEIKVSAKVEDVRKNNMAILDIQRKNAVQVTDGIGSDEMSAKGAGTAEDALRSVVGVTTMDGTAYVRGLGDRFATTSLNGSSIPSPDPARQTAPVDIIPAGMLENIVVSKTFTPDKPGNFAGGRVDLITKDFPSKLSLSVSSSAGYNAQRTGEEMFVAPNSSTDWAGYDDGKRQIPQYIKDNQAIAQWIPTVPEYISNRNFVNINKRTVTQNEGNDPVVVDSVLTQLFKAVRYLDGSSTAFDPTVVPETRERPWSQSHSMVFGNSWNMFGRPLGVVANFNYSKSYTSYDDGIYSKYSLGGGSSTALNEQWNLNEIKGVESVLWGAMGSAKYSVAENHKLGVTLVRNQSGISEAMTQRGPGFEYLQDQDHLDTLVSHKLSYTERDLRTYQFSGEHLDLFGPGVKTEWQASISRTVQSDPDVRYFNYELTPYVDSDGETQLDSAFQTIIKSNLFPKPSRLFREIEESNNEIRGDLTIPGGKKTAFKTGLYYQRKERTSREERWAYPADNRFSGSPNDVLASVGFDRFLIYPLAGGQAVTLPGVTWENLDEVDLDTYWIQVFYKQRIDQIIERPRQYRANQTVTAGYGMIETPLTNRLVFTGGLRVESTDMFSRNGDLVLYDAANIESVDALPSINFTYRLKENVNLRAAYGRTLSRPSLREISPAASETFGFGVSFIGNANLVYTRINNFDLRYEWFIRPGEILAVSGFYKYFSDPIEFYINGSNGNSTVQNVPTGVAYGVEVEVRRRLDHISPLLANFRLGGNLAVIHSEVDLPQAEIDEIHSVLPKTDTKRPMAGQSPYIINLDLAYENDRIGTQISLSYNVFGERFTVNTRGASPDVYEQPTNMLNARLSQRLFGGPRLNVGVKNILNDEERMEYETIENSQGFELINEQTGEPYLYSLYKPGVEFSIGLSYEIF